MPEFAQRRGYKRDEPPEVRLSRMTNMAFGDINLQSGEVAVVANLDPSVLRQRRVEEVFKDYTDFKITTDIDGGFSPYKVNLAVIHISDTYVTGSRIIGVVIFDDKAQCKRLADRLAAEKGEGDIFPVHVDLETPSKKNIGKIKADFEAQFGIKLK